MAPQALQQLWWHHFHHRHSNVQRWMQHVKSCLRQKRENNDRTTEIGLRNGMISWYPRNMEYRRLQVFCLFVTFFAYWPSCVKTPTYWRKWDITTYDIICVCVLTLDCGCKISCQKLWLVTSSRGSCMIYVLFFSTANRVRDLWCVCFLVGLMDISVNWLGVNVEILT